MVHALVVALLTASLPPGTRIAVLPSEIEASAGELPTFIFDDAVLAAVQQVTASDVIGRDDIESMLGFEKQKGALGCDDTSCFAELGGALGVDRLMSVKVARIGEEWVVSTKLIDIKETRVDSRSTEFVPGGPSELIASLPSLVSNLVGGGGLVLTAKVPDTGSGAAAPQPQVTLPAMDDVQVAVLMRQPPEQTAHNLQDLNQRLWPHPFHEGAAPAQQSEADGRTLELLARVEARQTVGMVDVRDGRARYDDINHACLFGNGETSLCHESAALVLAEYTDDTAYRAAELYMKACERKDAKACDRAKVLTASFNARERKRDDGGRLLSKLCLAGDRSSCEGLKTFEGKGWSGPIAMACAADNRWACSVVVARDEHWILGQSQRSVGFWMMVLGTPLAGGLGALIGFYAGFYGSAIDSAASTVDSSGTPSATEAAENSFIGAGVGAGVGAVVGFSTGLVIWLLGRAKVSHAEDLAEEYEDGGTAAFVPPLVSPTWLTVRHGDEVYNGPGLVLAF